jgi:hypothetical protein
VERSAAEAWIREYVRPTGPIETTHDRPWATVWRVPVVDGFVWFKACAPVQAFEPRLTAELSARWPDRVTVMIGHDEERAWMLLADAGNPVGDEGNSPESWLEALLLYAEVQRGEADAAGDHLAHGVPFAFLEEVNGLTPGDPWFARLRDAYLEPWGGLAYVFALALRVGALGHAIADLRQRDFLPEYARPEFDESFAKRLRRAVAVTIDP